MLTDLFVYGTLMYPALFFEKTGEVPNYTPAELHHYSVRQLNGRPYPGLVKETDGKAVGLLVRNVSAESMALLDQYEGEEYELIEVTIRCEKQEVKAKAYAIQPDFLHLIMEEVWQADKTRLLPKFFAR